MTTTNHSSTSDSHSYAKNGNVECECWKWIEVTRDPCSVRPARFTSNHVVVRDASSECKSVLELGLLAKFQLNRCRFAGAVHDEHTSFRGEAVQRERIAGQRDSCRISVILHRV